MSTSIALHSFFARRFNIPRIADDISKWEEAWEGVLGHLSSSQDVYPVLKELWNLERRAPSAILDLSNRIRGQVLRSQDLVHKLLDELHQRAFMFVMLKDEDLKRHLLNGIKDACAHVSLRENARALCPEITISTMMNGGHPIFDKFSHFLCGFMKLTPASGGLAFLESDWWKSAVSMPEPWPEDVQFAFHQLTVQRNEFIIAFILHTLVSLVRELNFTSPIANLVKSEGFFSSSAWSNTSTVSGTTPIRCAYCTGSLEELGVNVIFMVCSKCRTKANTAVHYCSRSCQTAHWNKHKSQCGKVMPPQRVHSYMWSYDFQESEPEPDGWPLVSTTNVTGSPMASNPERPLSPALQRQIAILRLHPDADYIFFDDQDCPIPFTIPESDRPMRMLFEQFLEGCMFGRQLTGLNVIGEYMVVTMARKPGLSVARILAQLSKEFETDLTKMMVEIQSKKIEQGLNPEKTFLEEMSRDWTRRMLSQQSES